MTGDLYRRPLTRRRVLIGVAAIATNALAAACGGGSSATDTPKPAPTTAIATPIPATATTPAPTAAPATSVPPTIAPTVAPTIQPTTPPTAAPTLVPTAIATAPIAVPTSGTTLATTTASPTTPLIIFAGGSNVYGTGVAETENFAAQTIALLAPAKYDAVNLGLRGQTVSILNSRGAAETDPLYTASRSKNIVVVYNSGGNDMLRGVSGEEVYAGLVTFCKERRSVRFKVVIMSCLPGEYTASRGREYETERQGINASIRKNLASFADALADVGADSTIGAAGAQFSQYYQSDGTHLTAKGHSIAAGIVKAAILTL